MRIQTFLTACLILIFFCGSSASSVLAQNTSTLMLADQYSAALKKFQGQKRRTSVEGVLRKGKAVDEKPDDLESLSEAEYLQLEKKMKGFVVNRNEIVFVKPDSTFFARLAKSHGTKSDVAFFALMHAIRPDNVWVAYIEQQTDYSGCTSYGNGLLTELYRKALSFKKIYPKAYVSDVKNEINEILEEFTMGTCACGNRKGVLKEFRLFIKTFPKDKQIPEIRERLRKMKETNVFRFNCQSG